ncbi:MAG: radical SAM protein [Myxococcota bacterium]
MSKRLEAETGTLFKEAPESIALLYPSPYHVGMSSLGYQSIYRQINESPGRAAHRAFLPEDKTGSPLLTYEGRRAVGDYPIIAVSVAYELEIAGLVESLEAAGVPALRSERTDRHPFILAGGPLTFSNPLPLAPFVDAVLMGEADQTIHEALDILFDSGGYEEALRSLADHIDSCFVPSLHGDRMPPIGRADDSTLPAYSCIRTPNTELSNMFLIEPERGCHRGCSYCVMRRSTNGGMRTVTPERIFELIPESARKVGLVGAAVTDHPKIIDIVASLAEENRRVSLSSLRADRLSDPLVAALKKAGNRSLTTASDGASQRLRTMIQRRARENELTRAAELVRAHGLEKLKIYMMVGLPTETTEDIDELIDFGRKLSRIVPIAMGIAPFVAKRNTPLDGATFAGIQTVEDRLKRLRKGLKGCVDLRATSARWAWIEYVLAQGGAAEGEAVLRAVRAGGRFRHWKDAFDALPADRPRRLLVIPGNRIQRKHRVITEQSLC